MLKTIEPIPNKFNPALSIPSDKTKQSKPKAIPIVPMPLDAPEAQFHHYTFGDPKGIYCYTNETGQLCFYVVRFKDNPDGNKNIRPLMFCNLEGKQKWSWEGSLDAAQLYNLKNLVEHSDKPVLIVEGEKTADAAAKTFVDRYCVITSLGGSPRPHKTNWAPLRGRDVTIWPDNDQSGQKYLHAVAKLAQSADANSVRIVQLPPNVFPERWDLADPFPEGITQEHIEQLLCEAKLFTCNKNANNDEIAKSVKHPFRLTSTHVQIAVEDAEGTIVAWQNVCTRIEILAQTRSTSNENWGRYLRWKDSDGNTHEWALPMRMLAAVDCRELREYFLDNGVLIEPGQAKALSLYFQKTQPSKRLHSVSRIGWHSTPTGSAFVLPGQTFGDNPHFVFQDESALDHAFRTNGTLEEWNEYIAQYAVGNSRLIFAISMAFAATLLELTEAESGGVHLRGGSSIGKTTILFCAGSVFGGGGIQGYTRQWRATANGIEGIAAMHCDALLCLDEIGQVNGHELGDCAYLLANGTGKTRAGRSGGLRKSASWRLLFLSTGEISLAEKIAEDSKRKPRAGHEVRIIDIPAECDSGMGIFEELHGFSNGDALSRHLKETCKKFYGTPIREFLAKLSTTDRTSVRNYITKIISDMTLQISTKGADGQVKRVANRFALIAAAGELAIHFGILQWDMGTAIDASRQCFQVWLEQRGDMEPLEITQGIAQVRKFFQLHGSSRFTITSSMTEFTINRTGYIKEEGGKKWFLVYPTVFKDEIIKGHDHRLILQALLKKGILIPGEDGRFDKKERLPKSNTSSRFYVLSSKILSEDGEESADQEENEATNF